eukprot:6387635-Prymnesium_polylepis.1
MVNYCHVRFNAHGPASVREWSRMRHRSSWKIDRSWNGTTWNPNKVKDPTNTRHALLGCDAARRARGGGRVRAAGRRGRRGRRA